VASDKEHAIRHSFRVTAKKKEKNAAAKVIYCDTRLAEIGYERLGNFNLNLDGESPDKKFEGEKLAEQNLTQREKRNSLVRLVYSYK